MEVANMTELLKYHDNTLIDKDLLPLNEQREQFLEMESTPGEDAMNLVQMTKKRFRLLLQLKLTEQLQLRGLTSTLKFYST